MKYQKSEQNWVNANSRINLSKQENRLRAAVLGANDGIVSIAGLVIGVAEATQSKTAILTAGLAGIIAGAMSMAVGEYVSVSTQRDTEESMLNKERKDLLDHPQEELEDLANIYKSEGLSTETAKTVARELSEKDALGAHADVDLHIDMKNLTNPWSSMLASAGSFVLGSLIPLIAIMLPVGDLTTPVTFGAVIVALLIAGIISARASGANIFKSTLRVVIGGIIAMVVTYVIGNLFKVAGV
ncbi:MAG: VIT family protein [Candidatus Saccharibacteria bacterium]